MQKWEMTVIYSPYIADFSWIDDESNPDIRKLVNELNNVGRTTFQELKEATDNGWEPVSVTPITGFRGQTLRLMFTFKRLIEEVEFQQIFNPENPENLKHSF